MVVGDGMADRPIKELDNRTPLEVAKNPNMNFLASNGVSGVLYPLITGMVPESDAANLAILGYDSNASHTGRGPLEAAGAGIKMRQGDVAFRCNFATVANDFTLIDPRAGRIREGANELAETIAESIELTSDIEQIFRRTLGFRGALVLRGEGLSPNITTSPLKTGAPIGLARPNNDSRAAQITADALNEFVRSSYEILKDHPLNIERVERGEPPANIVIPWGAGTLPNLPPFRKKYGLKAACVAEVSLIKGIGNLCGMTTLDVLGATGETDTDTAAIAEAALKALKNHDFVLVHVEGPDEASHDGDIAGKISIIHKIDSMLGSIMKNIPEAAYVVLLADHTTSLLLCDHTSDPTPIVVTGPDVVKDDVRKYNERQASRGGLGHIRGQDVMPILLSLLGMSARFGGKK